MIVPPNFSTAVYQKKPMLLVCGLALLGIATNSSSPERLGLALVRGKRISGSSKNGNLRANGTKPEKILQYGTPIQNGSPMEPVSYKVSASVAFIHLLLKPPQHGLKALEGDRFP